MNLSQLCLLLGAGMVATHLLALLKPGAVSAWLQTFPRQIPLGVVLMLLGTAWFEWNLWHETLQDIAPWKNLMLVGFAAVGVGCCLFVKDYLAVRGFCVVLLMTAWWMCEQARWNESPWRNAITGWAYLWVFFAMWWSLAPWRLRDGIAWLTRVPGRLRLAAAAGVAWGVFVVGLGLKVFR
ncbi:MAG TPA: hypothetical protein PLX89_10505 [Verrucomicrobiota bacterium]|nr:hypothetical protein [Verrucomicrobiota bacterium]